MKTKTKGRKFLSTLLSLCMVLGLCAGFGTTAMAANTVTLDLAAGKIIITATGYKAAGATTETAYTGDYYIMQSNNTSATKNTITIDGGTHNITIDGLNVEHSLAIDLIDNSTHVNLFFTGTNTLVSNSYEQPTISVFEGNTLTLAGDGILNVESKNSNTPAIGPSWYNEGDYYYSKSGSSAELGIGINKKCGTVIINSGTLNIQNPVTSIGGRAAAGIGGMSSTTSYKEQKNTDGGNVTINGGTVYIKGGGGAAGIGGGYKGTGGTTVITGGSVNVVGGAGKAQRIGNGNTADETPGKAIPPTNGSGTTLYRTVLTLDGAGGNAAVASVEGLPDGYNLNSVATDASGKLYFYLPENTTLTKVKLADGRFFEGTVTTSSNDAAEGTFKQSSTTEERSATISASATIPSPSYTVTIPATVDAGALSQKTSSDADKIKSTEFTVSAASVENLFGAKKIVVTLSTADGKFELADGAYKLAYSVFNQQSGGSALASGAGFTEFTAAGSKTGRIEIDQSTITRKGSYTGTMTFTISLADVTA